LEAETLRLLGVLSLSRPDVGFGTRTRAGPELEANIRNMSGVFRRREAIVT